MNYTRIQMEGIWKHYPCMNPLSPMKWTFAMILYPARWINSLFFQRKKNIQSDIFQ